MLISNVKGGPRFKDMYCLYLCVFFIVYAVCTANQKESMLQAATCSPIKSGLKIITFHFVLLKIILCDSAESYKNFRESTSDHDY